MFLFFTNMSYESLMYNIYNQGDPTWNKIDYANSVRKQINLIRIFKLFIFQGVVEFLLLLFVIFCFIISDFTIILAFYHLVKNKLPKILKRLHFKFS